MMGTAEGAGLCRQDNTPRQVVGVGRPRWWVFQEFVISNDLRASEI